MHAHKPHAKYFMKIALQVAQIRHLLSTVHISGMKALGGEFLEICSGIKGVRSVSNASSEVANLNTGASVSDKHLGVQSSLALCVRAAFVLIC
jgi:hypothetical protein